MLPLINLHNDLLGCVECNEKELNFHSRPIKAALPQLKEGSVLVDVLPLATLSLPESVQKGKRQVKLYQKLLKDHSDEACSIQSFEFPSSKIYFMLAIENASTIALEDDPLELVFKRLDDILKLEHILYVGLTWNQENCFGGGNLSNNVGLKPKGEEFVRYLHGKKIAVDLSHTSDRLAFDLLNVIDKKSLDIPVLASHSNYREVHNVKRNLPDELVQEVIQRKGLIGFNFVRHFLGEHASSCFEHIEYALKLGAENQLALGADFFGGFEAPANLCSTPANEGYFFDEYPDSSCFPRFFEDLKKHFDPALLNKLAFENALQYFLSQGIVKQGQVSKQLLPGA